MGIVTVFFIGLVKLWLTNRHMRRLEALDAEKQVRIAQMRKSGIRSRPGTSGNGSASSDGKYIPFGVKAIQAGLQVDGIWVARMASFASRPPERKWNSQRKVKNVTSNASAAMASQSPPMEMGDLRPGSSGPSKKVRKSPPKTPASTARRDVEDPARRTRDKMEKSSLLEGEERRSRDLPRKDGNGALYVETSYDEQDPDAQHEHRGALGRIQRGLRKMRSSEARSEHKKSRSIDGRLDAKEFNEKAQGKKPQRFYPATSPPPQPLATSKAPPKLYQASKSVSRQASVSGSSKHVSNRPDNSTVVAQSRNGPQSHGRSQSSSTIPSPNILQRNNSVSSTSSADSFVTVDEPGQPSRHPSQHQQTPQQKSSMTSDSEGTEGGLDARRSRPEISPRSSSLRRSHGRVDRRSVGRRDSLERSGDPAEAAGLVTVAGPAGSRYPPNSSRSAPVPRRRSSSSTQQQQQVQHGCGSMPPSPTAGPGDA